MYKLAAAFTALVLAIAPAVAGEHAEDESIIGIEGLYVADNGLFEESNEHSGLQRDVTVDEEGRDVEADTAILTL